jgi:hypothetical protein
MGRVCNLHAARVSKEGRYLPPFKTCANAAASDVSSASDTKQDYADASKRQGSGAFDMGRKMGRCRDAVHNGPTLCFFFLSPFSPFPLFLLLPLDTLR